MARRRLAERKGAGIALTAYGVALARRLGSAEPFGDQHRDVEQVRMEVNGSFATVAVNLNESPLAALMRRKAANGEAYLSEQEFRAGERLRTIRAAT